MGVLVGVGVGVGVLVGVGAGVGVLEVLDVEGVFDVVVLGVFEVLEEILSMLIS